MMKKFLLMLTFYMCLLAVPAFAQQDPPSAGNLTGTQVTDETAAELWMNAITQLQPQSLIQDTLINNVGLTDPNDITLAENGLASFASQYSTINSTYNAAINGVTDQSTINAAYTTYVNAKTALTNNIVASAQSNMTAAGFATLDNFVLAQKQYIVLGDQYYLPPYLQQCQQHSGYSSVETATLTITSWNPPSPPVGTVTFQVVTSGSATTNGACTGYNIVQAVANVNGHKVSKQQNAYPTQYVSVKSGLLEDSCLNADSCGDDDSEGSAGCCGGGATNIFNYWYFGFWETAFTMTTLDGIGKDCYWDILKHYWCDYPVQNWCNYETSPPDNTFQHAYITDIKSYPYWIVVALMYSWSGHQPWANVGLGRNRGTAVGVSNNLGYPNGFDCTYNP